jgi:hypothetical protein
VDVVGGRHDVAHLLALGLGHVMASACRRQALDPLNLVGHDVQSSHQSREIPDGCPRVGRGADGTRWP